MASAIHILVMVVHLLRVGACLVRERGTCLRCRSRAVYTDRKEKASVYIFKTQDSGKMSNERACPEEWSYGLILLSCLEPLWQPLCLCLGLPLKECCLSL
jgi:hypothetical protein